MKIEVVSKKYETAKTDAIVFPVLKDEKNLRENIKKVDALLDGAISNLKKSLKFSAEEGKFLIVPTYGKIKAEFVILAGLGENKKLDKDTFRRMAAYTVRKAKENKLSKVLIDINLEYEKLSPEEISASITEGAILGSYSFDKYFSKKENHQVEVLEINTNIKEKTTLKEAVKVAKILAEAQNFTRDLVNEPANVINTVQFAKIAEDLAKQYGFEIKIYDEKQIEEMGMGAYLAVAREVKIHLDLSISNINLKTQKASMR